MILLLGSPCWMSGTQASRGAQGNITGEERSQESYSRGLVLMRERLTPHFSSNSPVGLGRGCRCFTREEAEPGGVKQLVTMTLNKTRETGKVLQQSTVQRLCVCSSHHSRLVSALCLSSPALPNPHACLCVWGGFSVPAHTRTLSGPLTHLFREMLMVRRARPKIMATEESARME